MTLDDMMLKPGLMKGQNILITGGGSGLGRVMAEGCLLLGANVQICGRRQAVIEEASECLLKMHGGRVRPHVCDIRDPAQIDSMLEAIWSEDGPLTGLVNNAAGNFISRTEDLTVGGFDAISNIVFKGTFYLTLACGKRWIAAGNHASVVSILATWVWNGSPFTVPSAMSKAGVNIMTQSLAVEWGDKGIRLNAVAPGPFPTEGMANRLYPGGERKALHDQSGNPLGRTGRMPELANLVGYLLAPGSEYVNGQTIAIDGARFQATGGNFAHLRARTDEEWAEARASIKGADAKSRRDRAS